MTSKCKWCGRHFEHHEGVGLLKDYCSKRCQAEAKGKGSGGDKKGCLILFLSIPAGLALLTAGLCNLLA